MIRLIAVAAFALAVATSAQAMSPAPLHQTDAMTTQVALGCGVGRTRVDGVCVARTTKRQVRRQVRRCAVWGAGNVCPRWSLRHQRTGRGRKTSRRHATMPSLSYCFLAYCFAFFFFFASPIVASLLAVIAPLHAACLRGCVGRGEHCRWHCKARRSCQVEKRKTIRREISGSLMLALTTSS